MAEPLPHERYPESQHVAHGLGYTDEQRTASLDEIAGIVERLRSVPAWKLTPYTETLFEAERYLSALEGLVVPDEDDDQGVEA
jgi:hypothetical protein